MVCYVCGEAGHIVPNCPKRAKKDKQVGDIRAVQVEEIGEGLMDPSMTTESLDYLRMMDRDNANKQHSMYLGQIFSLQKQRENKTGKRMELIQAEDRDNKKKEKIIGQDVWGDRPQMFVEVNGMRVLVLADSGATCSGASSWIFQQITGESVIIEGIMRGATGALKK